MRRVGQGWRGRVLVVTALAVTASLPAAPALARAPRPTISAAPTATTVLYGADVTLVGVTKPGTRTVVLQREVAGRWVASAHAAVTPAGRFTVSVTAPRRSTTMTLRAAVQVGKASMASPAVHIHVVAHAYSATISAARAVPVGGRITARGSVTPSVHGIVQVQQLQGATWRRVATARLTSTSRFTVSLPASNPGLVTLRVISPATGGRASGTSRPVTVAVQQSVVPAQPVAPVPPAGPQPTPVTGPPAPAQPDPAPVLTTEEHNSLGDSGNSNLLTGVGVQPPLTPAWADGTIGTPSSVVVGDGTVFATSGDGEGDLFVTALREYDGSIVWGPMVVKQTSASTAMLAFDRGHVFVLTTSCTLASFAASSGLLEWVDPGNSQWGCALPPVAADGHLVTANNPVEAIDESSGAVLWQRGVENNQSAPAIVNGKVIINADHLMPAVLDVETGRLLWSDPGQVSNGHTAAVAGGRVYAQEWDSHSGVIYDLSSGRRLGTWTGDGAPAVDPARGLMVVTETDNPLAYYVCSCILTGRSLSTGKVAWSFRTRDGGMTPPLIVDGVVYTTDWGNLYALDEVTGRLLSTLTLPSGALFPPEFSQLAAGDGLILASVSNGLVALRTDTTAASPAYEYQEYTPVGDCPDEQDVYYVSRTCNWTYPQPQVGRDLVRVTWDPVRSPTVDAKVEDAAGHVYAEGTGTLGLLELPTASVPAGTPVHVAVTDHGVDYAMDFTEALPRIDQPATLTPSTAVLGFGYVPTGGATSESVTLRNTGGRELAVTAVHLEDPSGGTFTGVSDSCTAALLPPGWPCTLRVTAHPTGAATVTGHLVVSTTAGDVTVALSAAGA